MATDGAVKVDSVTDGLASKGVDIRGLKRVGVTLGAVTALVMLAAAGLVQAHVSGHIAFEAPGLSKLADAAPARLSAAAPVSTLR